MTDSTTTLFSIMAAGAPRRRASAVGASMTFAWRSVLKVRHVPEQLADVLLLPLMFTVVFTYMFGGAISGSTAGYLDYILPGTMCMTVVLVTMYTGIGLNTDLASGAFDRFRSLPIWRPAPLVGALVGDVARYLIAASLVVVLGVLMGYRPAGGLTGVLAAIALALLFASSLSWIWTSLALVLRTPQSVTVAGMLVLFPLTFVSNVFVDPSTMPDWLQAVVAVNPVSHIATAVRGLMAGSMAGDEVGLVSLWSAALVIVFAPITMALYRAKG